MGLTKPPAAKGKIKILKNKEPARSVEKSLPVSNQSGFTLVELTIVLFLMALMLGVVGTNFYKIWQREQLKMSFRQVTGVLRQARSEAVSGNQQVQIQFDLDERKYWLAASGQERRQLPPLEAEKAQLVWQSREERQGHISFYGDGSSTGGQLTFLGPDKMSFTLVVDKITGHVRSGSR